MDSATAAIHVDGSSLSELNTVSQKAKQSPSLLHQKRGRGMVVAWVDYGTITCEIWDDCAGRPCSIGRYMRGVRGIILYNYNLMLN